MYTEPLLSSAQVMTLAGITSRKGLKDLRDDMKMGRTRTGVPRPFSIVEAVVLTLAKRLIGEAGMRRAEATAIAIQASQGVADLLQHGEPMPQRWLTATRLRVAEIWFVAIVSDLSPLDNLEGFSRLAVDLTSVAKDVLDAVRSSSQ